MTRPGDPAMLGAPTPAEGKARHIAALTQAHKVG